MDVVILAHQSLRFPDNGEMDANFYELHGVHIAELTAEGIPLRSDREAVDVISVAAGYRTDIVVIPVQRLDDGFFQLRTGIAGQILQKFVTYGFRVAVVGDISEHLQQSSALRDFVYECNNGSEVWFLAHTDELAARLQPSAV